MSVDSPHTNKRQPERSRFDFVHCDWIDYEVTLHALFWSTHSRSFRTPLLHDAAFIPFFRHSHHLHPQFMIVQEQGPSSLGSRPRQRVRIKIRRRDCLTHLQPVLSSVPFHRRREVLPVHVDPVVTSEPLLVAGQDHLVVSRNLDANSVVSERLVRVD